MKIRGPSHPAGPIQGGEEAAPEPRTSFAERLDPAGAKGATQATTATGTVGEAVRALEAGQTTPRAALDRLIAEAVDAQLGPDASVEMRTRLVVAMTELCQTDPLFGERLRRIGEKSGQ